MHPIPIPPTSLPRKIIPIWKHHQLFKHMYLMDYTQKHIKKMTINLPNGLI